jgi:hypothetical protein
MAETTKFTIYRDSWLRGEVVGGKLFRAADNRMCCLGQIGHQAGLPLNELKGKGALSDLGYAKAGACPIALRGLVRVEGEGEGDEEDCYVMAIDTAFANDAMTANDSGELSEEERETKITQLMLKANIELTFLDGVAPWFKEYAHV